MTTYLVTCIIAGEHRTLIIRASGHQIAGEDHLFYDAARRWVAKVPVLETLSIDP